MPPTLLGLSMTSHQPPPAAIVVNHVSKTYRIYDRAEDRLKHSLFWRFGRTYGRDFRAVHDVSFTVHRGESVGVIGRNGSGKSTLLQLIVGTLQPTHGDIRVAGRVTALLELGSGFNPEYTGRENVYLNGAIWGMSRAEIAARFDEIVAFADIGEFIEQPVKFYSSGMAVRLAFAVQAIIEKDILIVDEALAVGDEAFQRKCMRKLEDFRESGGTVLLVSHSTQIVLRQCSRCLFMNQGRLVMDGSAKLVTDVYQKFLYSNSNQREVILQHLADPVRSQPHTVEQWLQDPDARLHTGPASTATITSDQEIAEGPSSAEVAYGNGTAEIYNASLTDLAGREVRVLLAGERYRWQFAVRFFEPAYNLNFGMLIRTIDGMIVSGINTEQLGQRLREASPDQTAQIAFEFTANFGTGTYYFECGVVGETDTQVAEGGFLHRRVDVIGARVVPPDTVPANGLAFIAPSAEVSIAQADATPVALDQRHAN